MPISVVRNTKDVILLFASFWKEKTHIMCQRKDYGPRCYSDSNAALTAVDKKLTKLNDQLSVVTESLSKAKKDTAANRRVATLTKQKTELVNKIDGANTKRRSVLRDLDGTKTGRKNLDFALDAAEYGSREWRELNLRRLNAEANHVQREASVRLLSSDAPAPIRLIRKAA